MSLRQKAPPSTSDREPQGPRERVRQGSLLALRKPSRRTGVERATFATGWSSTRTHSRRTISSPARSVPSPKRWTSHSSRRVAATRYSLRPGTGTKSTSSTNRVPVPTGSNVHPKAAASICVASITRSNGAAFPVQTAASLPRSRDRTTPRDGPCRHLVGPGRTLRDTRSGREPRRYPAPVRRPVRRRSSVHRVPGGLRAPGSTYS